MDVNFEDKLWPKPAFVDGISTCTTCGDKKDSKCTVCFRCTRCAYKAKTQTHLDDHTKFYHKSDTWVLYVECDDSGEGREELEICLSMRPIDATGGQWAFEDGDLEKFGDKLVKAARKTGVKLFCVMRMIDPGLGLILPSWRVTGAIKAGVCKVYTLPQEAGGEDTKAKVRC